MEKRRIEIESSTNDWIKVAVVKAIEAFQASEEFCEEKSSLPSRLMTSGSRSSKTESMPSIQS